MQADLPWSKQPHRETRGQEEDGESKDEGAGVGGGGGGFPKWDDGVRQLRVQEKDCVPTPPPSSSGSAGHPRPSALPLPV